MPTHAGLCEQARSAAVDSDGSGEEGRQALAFGEQLSEREVTVLRLAASGLGRRQIADQLFISYNTGKTHLKTS